jgi:hypothetical protein
MDKTTKYYPYAKCVQTDNIWFKGNSNGTDTEWPKLVMKKCKGKNCYPEYKID